MLLGLPPSRCESAVWVHYEEQLCGTLNLWIYHHLIQMAQSLKWQDLLFASWSAPSSPWLPWGLSPEECTSPLQPTVLSRGNCLTIYTSRAASSWHTHALHCYFQITTLSLTEKQTKEIPCRLKVSVIRYTISPHPLPHTAIYWFPTTHGHPSHSRVWFSFLSIPGSDTMLCDLILGG